MPEEAGEDPAASRPRWWVEIVIVLAMYGIYTAVRNQFGSAIGESVKNAATENAYDIIAIERAVHLFGEKGIQDAFIDWDWFIRFWNIFYGFLHFAMTIGVMVYLWLRHPVRYVKWRTILMCTTALALIGFAFYPLMPPRLLGNCGEYGACDGRYSFVDTLVDPGGLWSFDEGTMQEISNQYAAMPSLHIAWAVWSAVAAAFVVGSRGARIALIAYPCLTVFAIVVTGNHYWIDAVGGIIVLGAGYAVGSRLAPYLPGVAAPDSLQSDKNDGSTTVSRSH